MAYNKKRDVQIEEAIQNAPPLDLEKAREAMESGADGKALGLPEGYQWIVAMHEAYKQLQELKVRKVQLESALFSFEEFYKRGMRWPGMEDDKEQPNQE